MLDDRRRIGSAYLDHLTDDDLRTLAKGLSVRDAPGELRRRPEAVPPLLSRPLSFDAVFTAEPFVAVSPFLVFAVAVHRFAVELASSGYLTEWLGPRLRVPLLGPGDLCDFVEDPWRRLFLVNLLASYTHVASGSVMVQTRRGWRRQRFSELDPVRLAGLLEVVPKVERPGVYRRLGDLALFLTGVFPDHTASAGFSSVAEARLLRSSRLSHDAAPDAGAVPLLEQLGQRWYRLAYEGVPRPAPRDIEVIGEIAKQFGQARRILNVITDRYLFPYRDQWFAKAT